MKLNRVQLASSMVIPGNQGVYDSIGTKLGVGAAADIEELPNGDILVSRHKGATTKAGLPYLRISATSIRGRYYDEDDANDAKPMAKAK